MATVNTARAAPPLTELAAGPIGGTSGIGIQLTTGLWSNRLNLTIGYSAFGLGINMATDGQPWNARVRLGGVPIYLSVYPFGSQFHLDAGLFINKNRIAVSSTATVEYSYALHGHTYFSQTTQSVTGHTNFNLVAPYFGIGWGNPLFGSRWTFTANAGVIIEGGANCTLVSANGFESQALAVNLAQSERQLNHDVSFMTVYPVVNIGFTYRF
jgi:hypothetical protein